MTQSTKDTIADMRAALCRFPRHLELDAASGDAGIIHTNNGDMLYHQVVMNYGDASAVVSIVNNLGAILDRLEALERVADAAANVCVCPEDGEFCASYVKLQDALSKLDAERKP